MGALVATLLAIFFVGTNALGQELPEKVQIILLILISLGLAWLHWSISMTQLSTSGFAARNRNPNYIAEYAGIFIALVCVVNVGITYKSTRVAATILGASGILLPIMYFLSW